MLKNRVSILITGFILFSSAVTFAGGEGSAGNGGGAVVCTNLDGTIASAKLLDLWEEEISDRGSTFTPGVFSEEVLLEAALRKFEKSSPYDVKKMRAILKTLEIKPVSPDKQLLPPVDTGLRAMRRLKGCTLQGVADFDDPTGVLTIDPTILAAMDPLNRAALKFHEALFKVFREAPIFAKNSIHVRKITAAVFADQPLPFVPADADRGIAKFDCDAGSFSFLIVSKSSGMEMHFTRFGGRPLFSQMIAQVEVDTELLRLKSMSPLTGFEPRTEAGAHLSVGNLIARLNDGFFRAQVSVSKKVENNPSYYPPFPFCYSVILRAVSEFEMSPVFTLVGCDLFTGSDQNRISVNHVINLESFTPEGYSRGWSYSSKTPFQCKKLIP